jgi:FtsP/CotA-like multicopper oxidase with cupredoxin domain
LPASFPAPTLKLRQGDVLDLTLHNTMQEGAEAYTDGVTFVTKLHQHGLGGSPLGIADNVFRPMAPSDKAEYEIKVPIDPNSPSGVFWYHPHEHGQTAGQVYGGLAGLIQIGSPLDAWQQYVGQYTEQLFSLTAGVQIDPVTRELSDANPSASYALSDKVYDPKENVDRLPTSWRNYVNGQFLPTLTIRPGETQIWTMANVGRNAGFNLGLTDGDGKNYWGKDGAAGSAVTLLGYDGNSDSVMPIDVKLETPLDPLSKKKDGSPNPLQPNTLTQVDPGARLTMAVTAPTTPGIYYLVSNFKPNNRPGFVPLTTYFDPNSADYPNPSQTYNYKEYQTFAVMTIKVDGEPSTTPKPKFDAPPRTVPDLYGAGQTIQTWGNYAQGGTTINLPAISTTMVDGMTVEGVGIPSGTQMMGGIDWTARTIKLTQPLTQASPADVKLTLTLEGQDPIPVLGRYVEGQKVITLQAISEDIVEGMAVAGPGIPSDTTIDIKGIDKKAKTITLTNQTTQTQGYTPLTLKSGISIDNKRSFSFDVDVSPTQQPGGYPRFTINGYQFPEGPMVSLQSGQVEEWTVVNKSAVDHPFHIHQGDFAVISINGKAVNPPTYDTSAPNPIAVYPQGSYVYNSTRDTVNVPAGGNVVIRFKVPASPGKYVFHCHILPHEDAGMMMAVLNGPNSEERRVAVGTAVGQGSSVLVQDGDGNTVGRVQGMPASWQGGVTTATGDVDGDLTQDIVTGPSTASKGAKALPTTVSVFSGVAPLSKTPLVTFKPFPETPYAGVTLATGDIDGDGKAEILVGLKRLGPSLVRIFRADGSLWRTLSGVLPNNANSGSGVTVASADFNGDNFDDIAIGAGLGKGREPLVIGFDGYMMGSKDPTMQKMQIFKFAAPGGMGAGVNLAAGYMDPTSELSYMANLVTTPQAGPGRGTATVWANLVGDPMAMPGHTDGMAGMGGMTSMAGTSTNSPKIQALFALAGAMPTGGWKLSVGRLGKQGISSLAYWANAGAVRYQSIDANGVVSSVQTPVS